MAKFPKRPDHPDFWLISQAVIDNDAQSDARQGLEDIVGRMADPASVLYMAEQRTLRVLDQLPFASSALKAMAGGIWLDAFMAGARFQALKAADAQSFKDDPVPDEVKVWVLDIDNAGPELACHTSLHSSREGAEAKLAEVVDLWGLREDFKNDAITYGISCLAVDEG